MHQARKDLPAKHDVHLAVDVALRVSALRHDVAERVNLAADPSYCVGDVGWPAHGLVLGAVAALGDAAALHAREEFDHFGVLELGDDVGVVECRCGYRDDGVAPEARKLHAGPDVRRRHPHAEAERLAEGRRQACHGLAVCNPRPQLGRLAVVVARRALMDDGEAAAELEDDAVPRRAAASAAAASHRLERVRDELACRCARPSKASRRLPLRAALRTDGHARIRRRRRGRQRERKLVRVRKRVPGRVRGRRRGRRHWRAARRCGALAVRCVRLAVLLYDGAHQLVDEIAVDCCLADGLEEAAVQRRPARPPPRLAPAPTACRPDNGAR